MSNISRTRGDTHPIRLTLTVDGVDLDVTGSSFLLTVSEYANPTANHMPLFSIVGEIEVPATGGVITFTPTASQADSVGEFFYDVQQIDATGAIRTVLKGAYRVRQDITKHYSWSYDFSEFTVGEDLPTDELTSPFMFYYDDDRPDMLKIESRDGVNVAALHVGSYKYAALFLAGGLAPGALVPTPQTGIFEMRVRAYLREARLKASIYGTHYYSNYIWAEVWEEAADPRRELRYNVASPNYASDLVSTTEPVVSTPGWWNVLLHINHDAPLMQMKAWTGDDADEPEAWDITETVFPDGLIKTSATTAQVHLFADNLSDFDCELESMRIEWGPS